NRACGPIGTWDLELLWGLGFGAWSFPPQEHTFCFPFPAAPCTFMLVTVETFRQEMAEALKTYDRYIICIDKTPEDFEASLVSLINKAIKAYESRGPQLRHGIALDRHVTVILSQSDTERPLCGIYFNLHSPYQKQSLPKTVKVIEETIGERRKASED